MFDSLYLDNLVGRALALNIKDGWVDSDKILYFRHGEIFLNLDNVISDIDDSVIEFPNVFDGILMDVESDKYDPDKSYHFIFPKDVKYIGTLREIEHNVINLRKAATINICLVTTFKNSIFDFSKCKNLYRVESGSFNNLELKEVVFGDSLIRVASYSFENAIIDTISFTNLKNINTSAFDGAKFNNADFGNSIISVSFRSLRLTKSIDKLALYGVDIFDSYSICEVKNIYLPYNLYGFVNDIQDRLDNIQKEISANQHSVSSLLDALQMLDKEYKQKAKSAGNLYNIQEYLFDYYKKDMDTVELICQKVMEYISYENTIDVNIYFYSDKYSIKRYDVEERDYEYLGHYTTDTKHHYTIHLYVEPFD